MQEWALPEINLSLCNHCGTCIEQCPTSAVEMGPGGPFIARPADCTYCAACEALCPEGAIHLSYEIVWEVEGGKPGLPPAFQPSALPGEEITNETDRNTHA